MISARKLLDFGCSWSRELWKQLGELGLLADIPEADGGIGAGPVGVMPSFHCGSRPLGPGPGAAFVERDRGYPQAIVQLGSDAAALMLPDMASGESIAVLAHDEKRAGIDFSKIRHAPRSMKVDPDGEARAWFITRRWQICIWSRHVSTTAVSACSPSTPASRRQLAPKGTSSTDSAPPISHSTTSFSSPMHASVVMSRNPRSGSSIAALPRLRRGLRRA
ncbi:hypothetical protein [Dokdonella sp.]|uniref:hypothetical protein n=1 Tax=Dokdonella sp. TaxID=2291710 RepID=UPI003527999D